MAVLVARTMAQMHEEVKEVHPFFRKPSKTIEPPPSSSDAPSLATMAAVQACFSASGVLTPSNPSVETGKNDRTSAVAQITGSEDDIAPGPDHLEVDLNHARRKRRKTASPNGEIAEDTALVKRGVAQHSFDSYGVSDDLSPEPSVGDMNVDLFTSKTQESETVESNQPFGPNDTDFGRIKGQSASSEAQIFPQKAKKLLRLNPKTGTIGSPPKILPRPNSFASGKGISGKKKGPKSLIVRISYGLGKSMKSEIGQKIDQILSNEKLASSNPKLFTNAGKTAAKDEGQQSTHPFFLGKAALKYTTDVSRQSLLAPNSTNEPQLPTPTIQKPRSPLSRLDLFTNVSGIQNFGSGGKLMKFPGAVEPIWPPSDMLHIRCFSQDDSTGKPILSTVPSSSTSKKSKYVAPETSARENILDCVAEDLKVPKVVEMLQHVDTENFAEPDPCLRLPVKHFESGFELQRRVRTQLSCRLPPSKPVSSSEDELQAESRDRWKIHPALAKLYGSISTSLTAFDRSAYESQSWVHKYAPNMAAEVLHSGREAFILKEWLRNSTVMTVETGIDTGRSRATSVASRRSAASKTEKTGKKKRSKKLEGFIVSSDEEDDEMDEVSEPDGYSPRGSQGLIKKTVIRTGDILAKDLGKLANAILVSGPPGCGKTAAVYAVAKELGFEVFEINSSSRRNGKDIMDRVGDMTQNHLVQSSLNQEFCSSQDDDFRRVSDALEADLKSGRQGTMNSFFKPQPKSISKLQEPSRGRKNRGPDEAKPSRAPAKQQTQKKQSLILFEEVDVLFEEDKQFWATIMTLISVSKRPIIMTTNDETVVPIQALSLHAIIRLVPPPVDLAVDYMLLVAANEGHALQRRALKALYQAQRYDFRGAMTELEFWCQIGVGDRRGGFDWFYPRLPTGIDRDANGNTIRVVSEGTYKLGMGWLARDFLNDQSWNTEAELEIRRELWDVWRLDISDYERDGFVSPFPIQGEQDRADSHRVGLDACEEYLAAMSVADTIFSSEMADGNKLLLDTHAPELSAKAREDFVIGYEVLEAGSSLFHSTLSLDMSIYVKSQCRQQLSNIRAQPINSKSQVNGELTEANLLSLITEDRLNPKITLTRQDLSAAFDPIASLEAKHVWSSASLEHSAFDRPIRLVVTEIASYVRSIVAYDAQLQQERARLSNLLSVGGKSGKRMRTTRSAMSALEGGKRNTTRRERWFGEGLNRELVMKTGQQSWLDAVNTITENVAPGEPDGDAEVERAAQDEASPADSTG